MNKVFDFKKFYIELEVGKWIGAGFNSSLNGFVVVALCFQISIYSKN